jgi:hypothetical protein
VNFCTDIREKIAIFESTVSLHLLVEYMMEIPLPYEKKRKTLLENNVSKYYTNGIWNDFYSVR